MSTHNNGELTFSLIEKTDRNGEMYLFAGVQLLGVVVFVRRDGTDNRGFSRWKLVVKKYTGPSTGEPSDSDAWGTSDKDQLRSERK